MGYPMTYQRILRRNGLVEGDLYSRPEKLETDS